MVPNDQRGYEGDVPAKVGVAPLVPTTWKALLVSLCLGTVCVALWVVVALPAFLLGPALQGRHPGVSRLLVYWVLASLPVCAFASGVVAGARLRGGPLLGIAVGCGVTLVFVLTGAFGVPDGRPLYDLIIGLVIVAAAALGALAASLVERRHSVKK